MTRLLSGMDVAKLLSLQDAVSVIRECLIGEGEATPPVDKQSLLHTQNGWLRTMQAVVDHRYVGFKVIHKVDRQGVNYLVGIYDLGKGDCLALIDGDGLTTVRTAAIAALATDLLARPDANKVACLGSGREAAEQLRGLALVRPIQTLYVYSPHETHRRSFAQKMQEELGITVTDVASAEQAVSGVDLVVSATNSSTAFVLPGFLQPGVHYNAMGSTRPEAREAFGELYKSADRLVVDAPESAFETSGDLIEAVQAGLRRSDVLSIHELIFHPEKGRRSLSDKTVFKSVGSAYFDVALGSYLCERAADEQIGMEIGRFPVQKSKA